MKKAVLFFFLPLFFVMAKAQNVLIIYDVNNANTQALKTALQNAGCTVSLSATDETGYNGTNPALSSFNAVIHLNGVTYSTDMPVAGQNALVNFVQNGGTYIGSEWNSYEFQISHLTQMRELILLDRTGGVEGSNTYTTITAQAGHPLLMNIPASFTFSAGMSPTSLHSFSTQPATALMNDQYGTPSVAFRYYGSGKVVGFNHAGNYAGYAALSNTYIQQLYINACKWSAGALNFDGADDYVQFTNTALGNFGTSDFTIELNIRTTLATTAPLVSKKNVCGHENYWALQMQNGKFAIQLDENTAGANYVTLTGTALINDGQWHHLALVRKGTMVTGYVDGNTDFTLNPGFVTNLNNTNTLKIGTSSCAGSSGVTPFKGDMDELRFWSRALCQGEIANYKDLQLPFSSGNGLIAYYNFNQGNSGVSNTTVTTLNDQTGTYNGSLVNFALIGSVSNWVASGVANTKATIYSAPVATITAGGSTSICSGTAVTLTASAGASYQWYLNGSIISGATTQTYNAGQSGNYTCNVTSSGGCVAASNALTVTVQPVPTINTISGQTVCAGSNTTAINFTGTGSTYSWTNSNTSIGLAASGSGNISAFTAANTGTTVQTATITVTPVANGCTGATGTFTITVNPLPDVNQPANQVLCNGSNSNAVTFFSTVPGTIPMWSNDNTSIGLSGSGVGDIVSFTATNNSNSAKTATISVTPFANGCNGAAKIFTIEVDPSPSITSAATGSTCSGALMNYAITSNMAATYTWSRAAVTGISNAAVSNQSSATISEALINTTALPVNVTYTIIPTANGCTGALFTYTVTVNPGPSVNAIAGQTVCNGSATAAISFSGSAANATYSWTNSNTSIGLASSGTGSIAPFTAVNTSIAAASATINVVPSINGCVGQPNSFTIVVNPTPTVDPINAQTVCNNGLTSNVHFSGTATGTTFHWINNNTQIGLASNGSGDIASFTATNNTTSIQTATITVEPTANGCTGAAENFTISVNPETSITSAANGIVCSGANQNYSITASVPGTSFTWSRAAVAGIGNAAVSNQLSATISEALINTTNAPVNVIYTIVPVANGCTGQLFTYTVTVNPEPNVNALNTGAICSNTAQNYMLSSNVSGAGYTWDRASVTGISNPAVSGQTGSVISESLKNTTNNVVNVTYLITASANSCSGPVFSYVVAVKPEPVISSQTANTLCSGSPQNYLLASSVPGTTYSWSRPVVAGISNAAVSNQTATAITEALSNTNFAQVNAVYQIIPSANGCTGPLFNYTVTVNPIPEIAPLTDQTVCNGNQSSAINFSGPVTGTIYNWTNTNTSIGLSSGGTGNIASFTTVNRTNVPQLAQVRVTPSANGCTGAPQNVAITVNPTPSIGAVNDQTICDGLNTGDVNFSSSVNGTSYSWTNSIASIGLAASGTGNIPSFQAVNNGSAPVTAMVWVTPVSAGCSGIARGFQYTVNPATIIVTQPSSQLVCKGGAATLKVAATGLNLSYQWRKGGVNIAGATSPVYSLTTVDYADFGKYDVVVKGTCGNTVISQLADIACPNSIVIIDAKMLPNLVSSVSTVRFTVLRDMKIDWMIADASAGTVKRFTRQAATGTNYMTLDLGYLAAGTYYLGAQTDKGYQVMLRFVKL